MIELNTPEITSLDHRLVYICFNMLMHETERRLLDPSRFVAVIGPDEWTAGYVHTGTSDPMDGYIVLTCRRGAMADRSRITVEEKRIPLSRFVGDWSLPSKGVKRPATPIGRSK